MNRKDQQQLQKEILGFLGLFANSMAKLGNCDVSIKVERMVLEIKKAKKRGGLHHMSDDDLIGLHNEAKLVFNQTQEEIKRRETGNKK